MNLLPNLLKTTKILLPKQLRHKIFFPFSDVILQVAELSGFFFQRGMVIRLLKYYGLEINEEIGALIIYGRMDESMATPALAKIASIENHPLIRKVHRAVVSKFYKYFAGNDLETGFNYNRKIKFENLCVELLDT